jgi:hypothetical protein
MAFSPSKGDSTVQDRHKSLNGKVFMSPPAYGLRLDMNEAMHDDEQLANKFFMKVLHCK